ncbi:MAG: LysM peptidoglycan-binding domain-containing protein, partial [Proteobacteria bacterium]|nr:LysM peptidoglycan-binding domain-containing protein [Pseudomonadota bacterium]
MTHRIYTIFSIIIILFLYGCASTGVAPVANRDEVKEKKPTSTQRGTAAQTQAKKSTSRQEQNKSGYHIVEQGDTLYSIAWRYNFDYKEVANWNRIKSPYTIFPGQFIRLKPIAKKKGVALKSEPIKKEKIPKVEPKPKLQVKPVQKKQSVSTKKPVPKPVSAKGPIKWSWPTRGKLVKSNSPTSKKGIDISGKNGQI